MFETISDTLGQCFSFIVVGAIFGFLYDFFRFLRLLKRHNSIAIALEDIVFMTIFSFVSFTVALMVGSGYFRLYYCFFEALGFFIYYFTLGKLVYSLLKKSIGTIKRSIKCLTGFIGRKCKNLIVFIKQKLTPTFVSCNKIIKKSITKRRKVLQKSSSLLYNSVTENDKGSENKNAIKGHIRKKT